MAFKLIIKPIVFVDADDAVIYYEKKITGLGKRFYAIFLLSLNKIFKKPFTFSYKKNPVSRCKVEKFPCPSGQAGIQNILHN
jgi:hypothetical protein